MSHMKRSCAVALLDLAQLQELATDHGITIRASEVWCRREVTTVHVMFEDQAGNRILDWWPGSGRIWSRKYCRGRVKDGRAALDEAVRLRAKKSKKAPTVRSQAVREMDSHLDALARETRRS